MGQKFDNSRDTRPEGFSSGTGTFFKVEEDAAPALYDLANTFPKAFSKALKSLGFTLKNVMQQAITTEGRSTGQQWAALSMMQKYRRMDVLKSGGVNDSGRWGGHTRQFGMMSKYGQETYQLPGRDMASLAATGSYSYIRGKRKGKSFSRSGRLLGQQQSIPNAFFRWRGGNMRKTPYGGNMRKAIRYKMQNDFRVDIGAVSASAARFLSALQTGGRGSKGIFQFTGQQPVTPAMRRAFWAAGVPLSKNKTVIEQKPRPLVTPVFQQVSPQIVGYITAKIKKYMDQGIY